MQGDAVIETLLVEDNSADAKLLEAVLKRVSSPRHNITWARRLTEAAEFLDERTFDVVILDLTLPDSQGMDTVHAMLRIAPDIPVIAHTGNDSEELASQVAQAGCQDYLAKGTYQEELIQRTIRFAIERKKSEAAIRESEERFQDYARIGSDWFWEMGADLRFSTVTGNMLPSTGIDPEDFRGRLLDDIIDPETPDLDIQLLLNDLAHRKAFRNTQIAVHGACGDIGWIRISGKPMFKGGRFMGFRVTPAKPRPCLKRHDSPKVESSAIS